MLAVLVSDVLLFCLLLWLRAADDTCAGDAGGVPIPSGGPAYKHDRSHRIAYFLLVCACCDRVDTMLELAGMAAFVYCV